MTQPGKKDLQEKMYPKLFSDSLLAVLLLSDPKMQDETTNVDLHEIHTLIQSGFILSVAHMYRSANAIAHALAQYATSSSNSLKVRVLREDAEQYAYEKTSLQSLKAFEWLSVNDSSSSDDSPKPVVRIPRSYIPLSPPPSFYRSKEETNKRSADVKENEESVRATSAPRPRAVLSSPDNDDIIRSRIEARKQPSSILKTRDPSHNRHTQCKIFPKSAAAEILTPKKAHGKESSEVKNDALRAKGRVTALSDSRTRAAAQLKKMVPSWVQR